MNNTINNVNNMAFNSRFLNIERLEEMPKPVLNAIKQNKSIDEFIKAGQPKTFWAKIADLFKENETLNVLYGLEGKDAVDPYKQNEFVHFILEKINGELKIFTVKAQQEGIKRQPGSVPKPGENPIYKAPKITSREILLEKLAKLEDFGKNFQ